MANKVFISFRYSDGNDIKQDLVNKFDELKYTINKSEDVDRSSMNDNTIQKYLYEKLCDTSLTVVLITPEAVEHKRNIFGRLDDWMYDEIRYSLEDRSGNRTNAMIMVYTQEAKSSVIARETEEVTTINDFNNLARKNMFNVKPDKKVNQSPAIYNSLEDNYVSLVSLNHFLDCPQKYIDNAISKRERLDDFKLVKKIE